MIWVSGCSKLQKLWKQNMSQTIVGLNVHLMPFLWVPLRKENRVSVKVGRNWLQISRVDLHCERWLVVWVFFTECVWQKDNTLSQRSIHLRFQVAPGEFNLKSVGLDTLVINQLHPRVCLSGCVLRATCLCLCVINHCLFLYRTFNGRASFSQLKINSSWSDSLTIAGRENKIVLRQLKHTVLWDQSVTVVLLGNGWWKTGICHKKKL